MPTPSPAGEGSLDRERAALDLVSPLPPRPNVLENQLAHEAPIVLWRMQRADGLLSHAMLRPRSNGALVVWFVNNRVLGYRDFGDWTKALRWSDQLQAQNWAVGWRLAAD